MKNMNVEGIGMIMSIIIPHRELSFPEILYKVPYKVGEGK